MCRPDGKAMVVLLVTIASVAIVWRSYDLRYWYVLAALVAFAVAGVGRAMAGKSPAFVTVTLTMQTAAVALCVVVAFPTHWWLAPVTLFGGSVVYTRIYSLVRGPLPPIL